MRIAILGTGKIGESLLAGLRSSDWADIVATSRRQERADELHERHGVETTTSNTDAIRGADVVVLAVKPQDIETLLGEIGHLLSPEQTVLSIAAAITTARIERHVAADVRSYGRCRTRRRPSTRIAGMCSGRHAGREHLDRAGTVLRPVGDVVEVPEDQMDAITAVSGSGPLHALLAEAMIEAGILLGLAGDLHEARRADDARHGEAPARREGASRGAAGERHVAGRDDDPGDPGARASRRPRRLPERDQRRDGAKQGACARR
jgi:pyrroline-5-carboxylate reductase